MPKMPFYLIELDTTSCQRLLESGKGKIIMSIRHITSIELGDYQLGLLSNKEAAVIRQHIDCCPYCQVEALMLEDYLSAFQPISPPPVKRSVAGPSIFKQLQILVANLVNGPTMALAGGLDDEGPQVYEVGDVQISIQLQEDFEMPDRRMLMGLVTGTQTKGMQAHLWESNRPNKVAMAPVDEFGNFFISDLPCAKYELILDTPQTEIHIQALKT